MKIDRLMDFFWEQAKYTDTGLMIDNYYSPLGLHT